jgi:predicted hydrolase (HD superfamily)
MDREVAFNLVKKYNEEPFHIRHALTVEGAMKYFARKFNEDENYWGCVGLLHDVDFEKYPEEHCQNPTDISAQRPDTAIGTCSRTNGTRKDTIAARTV